MKESLLRELQKISFAFFVFHPCATLPSRDFTPWITTAIRPDTPRTQARSEIPSLYQEKKVQRFAYANTSIFSNVIEISLDPDTRACSISSHSEISTLKSRALLQFPTAT